MARLGIRDIAGLVGSRYGSGRCRPTRDAPHYWIVVETGFEKLLS